MNRSSTALLSVLLFILLGTGMLSASHSQGGDLSYTCINNCTTRVHVRLYRNCVCSIGPMPQVQWSGAPGCTPPPPIGGYSPQVTTELIRVCPGAATSCTMPGAAIAGVEEYYWYKDYDICAGSPCTYTLSWSECCRSPAVTNLVSPGATGMSITPIIVNTALPSCNNGPVFLSPPVVYLQQGQSCEISFGAYDADGDSLRFSMGPCHADTLNFVNYAAGYSPTSPLGPTWQVTLNPATGLMRFVASPGNAGKFVVCTQVMEYRNGQVIGSAVRDVAIEIINATDMWPHLGSISNVTGGATVVGDEIFMCNPGPICFDITGADPDIAQTLHLSWSRNIPGATFSDVGNSSILDYINGTSTAPPAGRFCWTPSASGDYFVHFTLVDNACPLLGISDRVIAIHVGHEPALASASLGTCPTVNFQTTTCGAGPYTYAWSGAGGLSSSLANPSHTYPGPGSYPWEVVVTNGFATDTIRDTVVVTAGPSPFSLLPGIHFVAPCTGTLYDTLDAGPANSYLWSTGATTQSIPVHIGGIYGITVSAMNGCEYYDSTQLYWASPDIYGIVQTSTGAALQNQKIMLIEHDTTLQALWALDSTWTDSSGYYFFCNVVDTLVFLKALPALADYPTQMPTYADTSLFWNNAMTFYPLTQLPLQHDFVTLFGVNPGGPGFIGGLITQGANKTDAVGDPMPGLRVFLRDANTGDILGSRVTDANGYFSFAGIPLGDYEIVPDRPLVSTTNVPALALTVQTPSMDSLDFQMHRYWLELVAHPVGVPTSGAEMAFQASPNPFRVSLSLTLGLEFEGAASIDVFDVMGKQAEKVFAGELEKGEHRFEAGEELESGIYFVRLRVNGEEQILKVMKY